MLKTLDHINQFEPLANTSETPRSATPDMYNDSSDVEDFQDRQVNTNW